MSHLNDLSQCDVKYAIKGLVYPHWLKPYLKIVIIGYIGERIFIV